MKYRLALLSLSLLLLSHAAHAQWALNGTPVCTSSGEQFRARNIADGSGGLIVTWEDQRLGSNSNIYAQKLDAYGVPKWTLDGVAVCTATNPQVLPALCSDGAGGCIIAWADQRTGSSYDIYAQRITAAGAAQWTANGVSICNLVGSDQFNCAIVSDGVGGAIITWADGRNGNDDIFSQRINSAGAVQWQANGKSVCLDTGLQQSPLIVSDGANGAIAAWYDFRNGSYDVYAQRIPAGGGALWTVNGVAVCTAANQQTGIVMVADGVGGAILGWDDSRSGTRDIYGQRINASGTALWTANGVAICTAADTQFSGGITTDGANGAIFVWDDYRDLVGNIYARRVTAAGFPQWQNNGVPVCTAGDVQSNVVIDSDGAGGAVMAWQDYRSGDRYSIVAQRIDRDGHGIWDYDGVFVKDFPDDSFLPRIAWNGGAALVSWEDERNTGGEQDIFAERVDGRYGLWGHPEPTLTAVGDVRGDQGGHVKVNWKASGQDVLGYSQVIPILYYSVWRAIDAASAVSNGNTLVLDDLSKVPAAPRGRTIYIQHSPATDYYWEMAGQQNALKIPAYSMSVETRADSIAGNANTHHFMVAAHGANEYQQWPSNEMTGRSVDNLAPGAPLFLSAYRAGSSVVLKWNRVRVVDLRDYSIYRKGSSGVTPVDPNFLDSTDDSTLVDHNAPTTPLYYIVTANDVHANQSAASNEASVSSSTGVGNMPPITGLMVMQNKPNPFGGRTTFDIGLPSAAKVSLEVFDVAGKRVVSRSFGTKPAGWQQVALDAVDDAGARLPSGVYFYRIHAAGQTVTRKMVIAR